MNLHNIWKIVAVLQVFNFFHTFAQIVPKNFTATEKKALEQFRSRVGAHLHRDFMKRDEYLIRWLRDQDYDLNRAQEKLFTSLRWRKENKVDSILVNEDFSDIEKLCPFNVDGRDKLGRPVVTVSLGSCPVRKILLLGNIDRLHRVFYFVFEAGSFIIQELQEQGSPVADALMIVDFNNFNMREHGCLRCIPIALDVLTLYENYYPLYVSHLFVINVPRVAEALIPLVWPLLSERSKQSVHIFGFNRPEWQKAILKLVNPDQIEQQYGGTKPLSKFTPLSSIIRQRVRQRLSTNGNATKT